MFAQTAAPDLPLIKRVDDLFANLNRRQTEGLCSAGRIRAPKTKDNSEGTTKDDGSCPLECEFCERFHMMTGVLEKSIKAPKLLSDRSEVSTGF